MTPLHSPSLRIQARPLTIPLRQTFRQASKAREAGASVLVRATRGARVGLGEGCPRPYQTGEDVADAMDFLDLLGVPDVPHLEALVQFVRTHRLAIDTHPAAWCAMELALLDLLAREVDSDVPTLLGLPASRRAFRYTVVVGLDLSDTLLARLAAARVRDLKVKVGVDLAADRVRLAHLRAALPEASIRVDANNAFGHDARAAIEHLSGLGPIQAIEEPLAPGRPDLLARVQQALDVPIILDECALVPEDLHAHHATGATFVLNVKVSRVGGVLRALDLVHTARGLGWGIIVGAQAGETSLLTRAGQVVAQAAGDALLGMEGAAGTHLLAWEPVHPSLRFGAGGRLDLDTFPLTATGWGLTEESP